MRYATDTIVRRSVEQVSAVVGNDAVILEPSRGIYYSLTGVGRRIWELIEQPSTVASLVSTLTSEYDVDPSTLTFDVGVFLDKLAVAGLATVPEGP